MIMADQVVDLEEAVGSYLNCLSTSCAAGSKLYTSVGKLIDEKFQELFPGQEPKLIFQALQTQNAFEGYQKALLDCKEKLLEILIDNHTKRQPTSKEKNRANKKCSTEEEQYAGVALRVAKELYCYHQTVAEVLKPLHFSDCQEDVENATLMNIDGKTNVVTAWMAVVEGNKLLRSGYGLSNAEMGQILCWQHGEDLNESTRKKLNLQVNNLIQQYVDRMFHYAVCEQDIPIAFHFYPEDLQKVLQSCCSRTESLASSAQGFLSQKEEITAMLHRELPRVLVTLNGEKYDKAQPGKAYENATLKVKAVRQSISNSIDSKKIDHTKEQLDLFCLRVLAIASISAVSAACRTAVVMAFGKVNLVNVQPIIGENEKHIIIDVHGDVIDVQIHSKWAVVEDSTLFNSLCRGTKNQIATIHVTYHAEINIEQFFVKRLNPTPVVHITQCILQQLPTNQNKKEQSRERSKSIKIKLTKATNKLFQRKSVVKSEVESDIITNEFASHSSMSDGVDVGSNKTLSENGYNTSSDSQDESQPVPPPRHKRKAKKTKRSRGTTDSTKGATADNTGKEKKSSETKKDDLAWYSASNLIGIPLVPTFSGSKDQSPSVASFEELQGVIDFLSGSSTSSLALNEKGEKLRQNLKSHHKRNNSTTSLPQSDSKTKLNSEGKAKLSHKKSASFSGKTSDLNVDSEQPVADEKPVTKTSTISLDQVPLKKNTDENVSNESSTSETSKSPTELVAGVERTPGDGMDERINKDVYQSTAKIDTKTTSKGDSGGPAGPASETEKDEVFQTTTETSLPSNAPEQKEETKKEPYFDSSDLSSESKHVTLSKQFEDTDIFKSLPSNLNTAALSFNREQSIQKSSTMAKLENNRNIPDTEGMWMKPIDTPTTSQRQQPPLLSLPPSLEQQFNGGIDKTMDTSNTLYEPFNSRTAWPVGLGSGGGGGNQMTGRSRFRALWSESTLENDKTTGLDEQNKAISSTSSSISGRSSESEFTLDKQQDFHKLLEGSKFFGGFHQQQYQDNWKDRPYNQVPSSQVGQSRDMLQQNFLHNNNHFDGGSDPWPVQSQSNFGPRDYSTPSYNNALQQAQQARSNIESLQLPQNPVGPYMRQNREQLLAKQQILEQYARQQKQMQLQQQQQGGISFPPSHPKGGGASMMSSRQMDRPPSSIAPPGLNKFDERPYYQRNVNQQSRSPRPMSTSNFSFGSGNLHHHHHHQTRSVNDIRMENNGGFQSMDHLINDRVSSYRDHYNQQDAFSTRY